MEVVYDNTNGYSEKVVINVKDWVTLPDYKIFGYFLSKPFGGSSIRIVGNILATTTYDILFNFYKGATSIGGANIKSGSTSFDYTITSDTPNGDVSIDNISVRLVGTTGIIPDPINFQVFMDNNIVLYNNKSENHRIDKTDFLTVVKSVSGTFRESISIISPVFDIEMEEFPNFNYLYIYLFNRYYYVDDIELVRTKLYRIYCHCDVLMSFKNDIKKQFVYVTRQENKINTEIPDTKLPVKSKPIYSIENMGSGLTAVTPNISFPLDTSMRTHYYALTVVSASPFYETAEQYQDKIPTVYNKTSVTLILTGRDLESVIKTIMGTDNIITDLKRLWNDSSDAFISLKQFPWDLINTVKIPTSIAQKWLIGSKLIDFGISVHGVTYNSDIIWNEIYCGQYTFTRKYNDWRDFKPFTKITLFIPYVGWVELNNEEIYSTVYQSAPIYFRYLIDVVSGDCIFQIYNYIKNGVAINKPDDNTQYSYINIISQYECSPSENVLLSDSNHLEILRKSISLGMNVITGLSSNFIQYSSDIEYANAMNMKQKGIRRTSKELAVDKSRISKVNAESDVNNINVASNFVSGLISDSRGARTFETSNNGFIKFNTRLQFCLKYEMFDYEVPDNYAHIIGYPSTYAGLLSGVKGYTEVGGVHLENIKNITSEELDEIDSSLRSGVLV